MTAQTPAETKRRGEKQPRMIPNPLYCEKCKGRGYLVGDVDWEPYAVQCDGPAHAAPTEEKWVSGWAVVGRVGIFIKTVSDTRRAAIINWLVTERQLMITNATRDYEIEKLWLYNRGELEVLPVNITTPLAAAPPQSSGEANNCEQEEGA